MKEKKNKKYAIIVLVIILVVIAIVGFFILSKMSEVKITWAESISGNGDDHINDIIETSDGGFIAVGKISSDEVNIGEEQKLTKPEEFLKNYTFDGLIIKYDKNARVEWKKIISGESDNILESVVETADGDFIVGGNFKSKKIKITEEIVLENKGNNDGMVIKYDKNGNCQWAKSIGNTSSDEIKSLKGTSDGGYIIGGRFSSEQLELGNNITLENNSNQNYDGMILKYNKSGECEWAKNIGGINEEIIENVIETRDKNYIAVGKFYSESFELEKGKSLKNSLPKDENELLLSDSMIIKLDGNGEYQWYKTIGGTGNEGLYDVEELENGDFITCGYFDSKELDLGNEKKANNVGAIDGILIQYTKDGQCKESKVIGGNGNEEISNVIKLKNNEYAVSGITRSEEIKIEEGKILKNNGREDGFLIKFDKKGQCKKIRTIGGELDDGLNCIALSKDNNLLLGGFFISNKISFSSKIELNRYQGKAPEVSEKINGYDAMIIKIKF